MTNKAKELYEIFKKDYVENGYLYSGSIPANSNIICNFDKAIFKELLNENKIQIRECEAFAYELTIPERKKLIIENNLAEIWEQEHPYSYPNDRIYGEVTKVMNA